MWSTDWGVWVGVCFSTKTMYNYLNHNDSNKPHAPQSQVYMYALNQPMHKCYLVQTENTINVMYVVDQYMYIYIYNAWLEICENIYRFFEAWNLIQGILRKETIKKS